MEVPIYDLMQISREQQALAAYAVGLREAARHALDECVDLIGTEEGKRLRNALSLPLPDAAREVEQWRESAELLDDWGAKWEAYCTAPTDTDEKEREAFIDADFKLRRYARELAALRAAKAGK